MERKILRIDKTTLDRFKFCQRVRKSVFHPWEQDCEYIPFSDKVKIKEAADKNMFLRVRDMPQP